MTDLSPFAAALVTLIAGAALFYGVYYLLAGAAPELGMALFTGAVLAVYQYYRRRRIPEP